MSSRSKAKKRAAPSVGWPAAAWSITVTQKGGAGDQPATQRLTQALPYARVGSHADCEVCLPHARLPDVAYLLCCVDGVVEAWPLAPLAMARSGPMRVGESLWIGTFRVAVEIDAATRNAEPQGSEDLLSPERPTLEFTGEKGRWSTLLRRPVTIMGDDHPSVMRLHAVGLRQCHGAFVTTGGKVWYLSLVLSDGEPIVQPLPLDASLRLGQIEVRSTGFKRGHSERSLSDSSAVDLLTGALDDPALASDIEAIEPEMAGVESQRAAAPAPPSERPAAPKRLNEHQETDADEVAGNVMHRMVRIGRRRWWRQRLLVGVFITVVTVIATIVILKVWEAFEGKVRLDDLISVVK